MSTANRPSATGSRGEPAVTTANLLSATDRHSVTDRPSATAGTEVRP